MCLVINEYIHDEQMRYRDFTKLPKPFITQKDIHCLKVLEFSRLGWFTPFKNVNVLFNNGVATLEVEQSKKKIPLGVGYYEETKQYVVNEGVHCMFQKHAAYNQLRWVYLNAIIPKGTMIYFGIFGDIVAEKMIIFEKKEQYFSYTQSNVVFDACLYDKSVCLADALKNAELVTYYE